MMLRLPIRAEGKQRARKGRNGWYTPERTRQLEAWIAGEWMAAGLGRLSGPLGLRVVAEYAPPKSWRVHQKVAAYGESYCGKPDADNVLKLIADALNGVAYADDKQIAEASIRQVYAERDAVTIEISEVVPCPTN